jgi:hypothetical protein
LRKAAAVLVRGRRLCIAAIALTFSLPACNSRTPVFEHAVPSAPTTVTTDSRGTSPLGTLFSLSFSPPALNGGGTARGVALLTMPAPPGGTVLTLNSGDPLVSVPASVIVPAGSDRVEFSAVTRPASGDTAVTVSGSAGGRSVAGTLSVWAALPTSFSYTSDVNDPIGRGQTSRFTPPNARFEAYCHASRVTVRMFTDSENFSIALAAPRGAPLRTGFYPNASYGGPAPEFPSQPGSVIDVSGNGRGCTATGDSFTVHEVDLLPNGTVRRFWATFEQRCSGRSETMRGEIRLTNMPLTTFGNRCHVP